MRLLFAFFLLIVFWSCSNPKERTDNEVQAVEPDSIKQTILTPEIRAGSNLPKNADLPFGPSILVNYKFPKEWNNREEDNPKEQLHVKKLSETQELFNQLNTVKSIKSPNITEIEFIRLKDFQDSLLFSIDSIKYRLPNFGPYECYYSWVDVKRPHEEKDYEERSDDLIETGNLILYEPKTKKAKVINIYRSVAGIFWGSGRYFYIDENKKINLYEHDGNEEKSKLLHKYTITVQENGTVKIK